MQPGLQRLRLLAPEWVRARSQLNRRRSTLSHPKSDSYGIPVEPTWSVNDLLSSYPQPTISPSTLKRLHELSALIPPAEGTTEHAKLTHEMEELVKLVEAVKFVDTSAAKEGQDARTVPDGRIWDKDLGIELSESKGTPADPDTANGRDLLRHSSRVKDGLYIVDADKTK